eukprot:3659377-Pleurochrysis_carterae.AAC.1
MRLSEARKQLAGVDKGKRNILGQGPLSYAAAKVVEFPHLLCLGAPESPFPLPLRSMAAVMHTCKWPTAMSKISPPLWHRARD